MTDIQIFESPEFGKVRTTIYKGEIAFVTRDVMERLGYADLILQRQTKTINLTATKRCIIPE